MRPTTPHLAGLASCIFPGVSFLGWITLCGGLLLLMTLSSAWIRRVPMSAALVYLVVGMAIGPWGTGWLRIDAVDAAPWLERLTEIAVRGCDGDKVGLLPCGIQNGISTLSGHP